MGIKVEVYNRGVELQNEVAYSDRVVMLYQVTNGVSVRMAILYLLSGGSRVWE